MIARTASEINRRSTGAVVVSTLGILFGPGPMIVGGLSLLITAISGEMHWSRTTFSLMPPFMAWTAAATAPLYGKLMDRYGLRRVILPAIAAFGLSFLAIALFTRETWHFLLAYFFIGAAAGALGPVGYNKLIAQWFTRSRGLVIALCAAAGSGVGYALAPQYVNWLITSHGWRGAYIGIGLLILCISLPAALILLRERVPEPAVGVDAPRGSENLEGLTLAQGLRTKSFWLLVAVLFLPGNAFYGILLHMVPIITDRGMSRELAATTISLVAIGAIGGQLLAGVLLDRVRTPKVALPFFGCGLAGMLLVHHGHSAGTIIPGGMLIGVGQGAELSVVAYMTSRLLGLRAFGVLYGLIYAGVNFAAGSGPLLLGYVFDRTGSYEPALVALEGGLVATLVCILLLGPYRYGLTPAADPIETADAHATASDW